MYFLLVLAGACDGVLGLLGIPPAAPPLPAPPGAPAALAPNLCVAFMGWSLLVPGPCPGPPFFGPGLGTTKGFLRPSCLLLAFAAGALSERTKRERTSHKLIKNLITGNAELPTCHFQKKYY